MEDMKKKHLMQLATQQHNTNILLQQIHQEKKQVKTLDNQIVTYQNELIAKVTCSNFCFTRRFDEKVCLHSTRIHPSKTFKYVGNTFKG